MKRQTNFRVLVAAVAVMAPLSFAHANDFIVTGQTGYFQQQAAMPKAPDMLALHGGHVRKNMLGWEFITYDNAAPGAQGPIREEMNPQETSVRDAEQGFWQRLYPVGAPDTP